LTATPISYATAVDGRQLPFKDRRTSLKAMGIVLIVLGSLSGCVGVLAPVGMVVAVVLTQQANANRAARGATTAPIVRAEEMDYGTMVLAAGMYLPIAALFIWVGIGSVRVRRWVRPVMLVIGWSGLIVGLLSFGHQAFFGADMREMMTPSAPPGAPQPPRAVIYAATAGMAASMFVAMVVLPALIVWVYRRRGVRDTLDFFDARVAWTDRCPTPPSLFFTWRSWRLGDLGACLTYGFVRFPMQYRCL
jgi:hypothetical protein